MNRLILYIVLGHLFLTSCITQFIPEVETQTNILVVEGLITNEDRTNVIRLTKTKPIDVTGTSSPVIGASVTIKDDDGNVTFLSERNPGTYVTDSLTFRGVPGRTYKLRISIAGEVYESDMMQMRPVPPIGKVYSEFKYTFDRSFWPPIFEYDVYFDTRDTTNSCRYYRWEYEEVWEYHLPWHYPPESKRICWITEPSSEILIKNTTSLAQDVVSRVPLVSLDNIETEKLSHKYSILLKQYSLNEDEYYYWENMKRLSTDVGGLYDPVPMPIRGNIHSISDPEKIALGYFSVSAVAQERHFIKNDTILMRLAGQYCVTDTLQSIINVSGLGKVLFVLEEVDGVGFLVSTYKQCADCTTRGTNIMPLFWMDDILNDEN